MEALGRYKVGILILLACSQALSFIDRVNLAVVVPGLIKDEGYSASLAGFLMSILNFAYVIALLAAGPLTDRLKPKRVYPMAVAVWSAATSLCGLTVQFLPLAFLRALVGIGEAPNIPSGSRVIRQTFTKMERGFAVSVFFAGNKVGLALGIPLASFILTKFGRPWVFIVTGLLGALWIVAWSLIYRGPTEADAVAEAVAPRISWLKLLRYRTTWGMMLGQAGYLYVYYVFATWLPGYLLLAHKLPTMASGLLAMLPFLVGIFCTILGGWVSDRLVARGATISRVRKIMTVGGIFGATILTILGVLARDTTASITLLTFAVGCLSFATAAANAMPIDVAPPQAVSSLAALQNFGGNIGGALAPLVTGALITLSGDFVVPMLTTAAVGIVFGCGGFGLVVTSLDKEIGTDDIAASKIDPLSHERAVTLP